MKVYAVKIWLTLVHSIKSYDGLKNVEAFLKHPVFLCIFVTIERAII